MNHPIKILLDLVILTILIEQYSFFFLYEIGADSLNLILCMWNSFMFLPKFLVQGSVDIRCYVPITCKTNQYKLFAEKNHDSVMHLGHFTTLLAMCIYVAGFEQLVLSLVTCHQPKSWFPFLWRAKRQKKSTWLTIEILERMGEFRNIGLLSPYPDNRILCIL